ncbi:hypothetical protein [Winogradskyella tangerina]|uniref:hypothetical protein n=1 Tax=Winogradskyella tangerina TaxID=2023240 RepID=UPI001300633F|nr:hypothetical protein [Winogradskyella tangerina]
MSKRRIILIHILSFIILTLILLFSAEPFLQTFASGIHHVEMWLNIIVVGTIGIAVLTSFSCFICLTWKRKDKTNN